jgi:hypothetical protein
MNLVEERLSIPELPEAQIKTLLRALNRANAAMKKWQKASGIPEHIHFDLVERGYLGAIGTKSSDGVYRGGKTVETR